MKLLKDSLAANCDKLRLSTPLPDAKDRVLRDILLHLYITMKDSQTIAILEPFKRLVYKPAEMKVGTHAASPSHILLSKYALPM